MNSVFAGLGRLSVRNRWLYLAAWVMLLAFGIIYAPRLQEVFEREFVSGNTGDSQRAADAVSTNFVGRSAFQQQLVLTSETFTIDDPAYREAVDRVTAEIEETGILLSVDSFFSTGDPGFVSGDRKTTYAVLNLRSRTHADAMNASRDIIDVVKDVETPIWLQAFVTGDEAAHADILVQAEQSLAKAEQIGLPVAMLVLLFVFGALVAAGLPLIMGVLSIVIALALAFVVGQFMNLSVFLQSFVTMIGLGVGIDYALFMVTRYRGERQAGRDVDTAVVETVTHAGKAIAFSGFTVIIGLSALLATGEPSVISIGVGGMLVVAVAVMAGLTLLPASLSILGDRLELPRSLTRFISSAHIGGFWERWAHAVMSRPLTFSIIGVALIAAMAWPTFDLKAGSVGVKMLGPDAQSRKGFEVVSETFGAGAVSPVQIVVTSPSGIGSPEILAGIHGLTQAIESDSRFLAAASLTNVVPALDLQSYQAMYSNNFAGVPDELAGPVSRLVNLDNGGNTAVILALLPGDPGSNASRDAVRALRNEIIPSIPELEGHEVLVGGFTALELDSIHALYSRFPIVIGIILVLTFALLLVLLRSIFIPLKAVVMNMFSVLASYGLLVLVFQKGIGDELLGFESIGAVNWVTPVLLFAILFGLSMDYEVFLMSRIRELHDRGQSNEDSVATGLERTGGVITGAAAIMVVVFAAFVLSPLIFIKEMGFGLAAAIFIDATIVRVVLVPSMMKLMGDRNWWVPEFLGKLLPTVELEGEGYVPISSCHCRPAECRCGGHRCTCEWPAIVAA